MPSLSPALLSLSSDTSDAWYRSLTDCAASLGSETRTEAFFSGLGPTDFSLPRGNYNPGQLPQEWLQS